MEKAELNGLTKESIELFDAFDKILREMNPPMIDALKVMAFSLAEGVASITDYEYNEETRSLMALLTNSAYKYLTSHDSSDTITN